MGDCELKRGGLILLSVVGITASVSLAGCDTTGQVVEDPIASGLLPADWPGVAMGVPLPVFRDEGKVDIARRRSALAGLRRGQDKIAEVEICCIGRAGWRL
jgi:hypothetical protein